MNKKGDGVEAVDRAGKTKRGGKKQNEQKRDRDVHVNSSRENKMNKKEIAAEDESSISLTI